MTIRPSAPHIPGSLPFVDAEEGFVWAGRTFGDRLRRIPDGETEPQRRAWQPFLPWFDRNPTLERGEDIDYGNGVDFQAQFFVKEGATVSFDEPFEFEAWARDSYEVFRRARDAGGLPAHTRLMVAMPSALDVVFQSTTQESLRPILDAYLDQLKVSIDTILADIPHADLAIQLDSVVLPGEWQGMTSALIEQGLLPDFGLTRADLMDVTMRQISWLPEDVEAGFHLCYGDGNQEGQSITAEEDFSMAAGDISTLVTLCNDLVEAAPRPLTFLHLATHQHWLEPEAYAPLVGLDVGDTEISLGVICLRRDPDLETGVANARKRAESARAIVGDGFGIATTCGMGRFTAAQTDAATVLFDELQPHR